VFHFPPTSHLCSLWCPSLCTRLSQCFSLCLHDSVFVSMFGSVSGCIFSISLSVCMSLCISQSLFCFLSMWFSPTLAPSSLSVLPSISPHPLSLPPPIAHSTCPALTPPLACHCGPRGCKGGSCNHMGRVIFLLLPSAKPSVMRHPTFPLSQQGSVLKRVTADPWASGLRVWLGLTGD